MSNFEHRRYVLCKVDNKPEKLYKLVIWGKSLTFSRFTKGKKNPYILVKRCLFVCLYKDLAGLILLSFTVKLLTYPGKVNNVFMGGKVTLNLFIIF